jgi:hypothetical protein
MITADVANVNEETKVIDESKMIVAHAATANEETKVIVDDDATTNAVAGSLRDSATAPTSRKCTRMRALRPSTPPRRKSSPREIDLCYRRPDHTSRMRAPDPSTPIRRKSSPRQIDIRYRKPDHTSRKRAPDPSTPIRRMSFSREIVLRYRRPDQTSRKRAPDPSTPPRRGPSSGFQGSVRSRRFFEGVVGGLTGSSLSRIVLHS